MSISSTPNPAAGSTAAAPSISVLFVCLGNICRSPMAEGVFRSLLSSRAQANYTIKHETIDSAGTGAYHVLSPPDPRTLDVLAAHSIITYTHSARKVRPQDFEEFDYIFAMDAENLEDLLYVREKVIKGRVKRKGKSVQNSENADFPVAAAQWNGLAGPSEHLRQVRVGKARDGLAHLMLFGAFGGQDPEEEVGDPYYGGRDGFEIAYEQVDRFSKGFLAWLDAATAIE